MDLRNVLLLAVFLVVTKNVQSELSVTNLSTSSPTDTWIESFLTAAKKGEYFVASATAMWKSWMTNNDLEVLVAEDSDDATRDSNRLPTDKDELFADTTDLSSRYCTFKFPRSKSKTLRDILGLLRSLPRMPFWKRPFTEKGCTRTKDLDIKIEVARKEEISFRMVVTGPDRRIGLRNTEGTTYPRYNDILRDLDNKIKRYADTQPVRSQFFCSKEKCS